MSFWVRIRHELADKDQKEKAVTCHKVGTMDHYFAKLKMQTDVTSVTEGGIYRVQGASHVPNLLQISEYPLLQNLI